MAFMNYPRGCLNCSLKRFLRFLHITLRRKSAIYLILCFAICGVFILHPSMDYQKSFEARKNEYQAGQICIHPEFTKTNDSTLLATIKQQKIACASEPNWVYVNNGTFRLLTSAKKRHGRIFCEYVPLFRIDGDYKVKEGKHMKPMSDGTPLESDFFKVACISQDKKRYYNVHAGIAHNTSIHHRLRQTKRPYNAMGYNVLMFGYDSVSRARWMEMLPKSHQYFTDSLKGIVLNGYNIVGDGTDKALRPILTGMTETELPESRRGFPNAKQIDDHPWIWKEFSKSGYVTQWAEDMQYIGTFQMRLLGFSSQPTDHYMRPFYLTAESIYRHFLPKCLGSTTRHSIMLNWIRDLYKMYKDIPKFTFGFHSEYSHNDYTSINLADEELRNFLKELHLSGVLDTTILILMSDHGSRFQEIRATEQGKLEERMPYFSFRLPPDFAVRFPLAYRNLQINSFRLTTPFDIHATFRSILNYTEKATGSISQRGISLFEEIPKNRECTHAHIQKHWCACLTWRRTGTTGAPFEAAQASLKLINSILSSFINKCHTLYLDQVLSAYVYSVNDDLLRFKRSNDIHGREANMSDTMRASNPVYQVTFTSTPGNGKFEATVKHDENQNYFRANLKQISRINRYNDDPWCIRDTQPRLRPFCFCKQQ